MIIYPAIDLYDKKAVRLYKGDYNEMTVYSENPCEIAEAFYGAGARYMHVVDLEGAKTGETPNIDVIKKLAAIPDMFIEVGGGIRTLEVAKRYVEAGVDRIILGTAALKDREFLLSAIESFGDKLAVGVDIKDSYVAVKGWIEKSEVLAMDFLAELDSIGVKTVICTDISKDGAMMGTNLELYRTISEKFGMQIIASGGVSSIDDVKRLREMDLYGAIVGKAYYTGAISLKEALEVAK